MQHDDPQQHESVSLAKLLGDFVRWAERCFPETRGRIALLNVRRNTYHISKAFNVAAKGFNTRKQFESYLSNHSVAKSAREKKDSIAAYAVREKNRDIALIFFNEKVLNKEMPGLSRARQQELLMTLDHELAHLVIGDAYNEDDDNDHGNLVEENIAESFAQLMHYKRFGLNGAYANGSGALDMARTFVFNRNDARTHFYYPTIKQIVACRNQINFKALKPSDLADLARRFAIKYTPSNAQVRDMDEAFDSCRKAYRNGGIISGMKELAKVTLSTPHPHVARLGIDLFLDLYPTYEGRMKGPSWVALRQKIKELDYKLAQEDILFRIPSRPGGPAYANKPHKPF